MSVFMAQIPNNLTEIQESFLEYVFLHLLHVLRKISGHFAFLLLFFFLIKVFLLDYFWSFYWICNNIVSFFFFLNVFVFCPWGMWDLSFLTRDWTCTSCIERQNLNHWTTREVLPSLFKKCQVWLYHWEQACGASHVAILAIMLCHLRWYITQKLRLSSSFWNFHLSKQNCVSNTIIVIEGRLMLLDTLKFLGSEVDITIIVINLLCLLLTLKFSPFYFSI